MANGRRQPAGGRQNQPADAGRSPSFCDSVVIYFFEDWVMPTTVEDRPPPERFLALIREQQRGRLKVYLGFAAGVGKTYEMLQEGQRLKKQGVDVVIGIVETHGRCDTMAQISDLEQVPRRRIEYRGVGAAKRWTSMPS